MLEPKLQQRTRLISDGPGPAQQLWHVRDNALASRCDWRRNSLLLDDETHLVVQPERGRRTHHVVSAT
jgi:hypothetical protein